MDIEHLSFVAFFIIVLYEFFIKYNLAFFSTWNHLLATFVIFPIHISCWHNSTWDVKILWFFHNLLCTCCWLLHIHVLYGTLNSWCLFLPLVVCQHNSPVPVLIIFFRHACQADPGADKNVLDHMNLLWKLLNTLANSSVSPCIYQSCSPQFFILKSSHTLFMCLQSASVMFSIIRLL